MKQEWSSADRGASRARFRIRFADPGADSAVRALLQEAELPFDDISSHLRNFILAFSAEELVGTVGIEFYGRYALLRSLAVTASLRGSGIGGLLYDQVINHARSRGAEEVYLLTTTAETFFSRRGFRRMDRESLPEPIQRTEECRELCPAAATCMLKII